MVGILSLNNLSTPSVTIYIRFLAKYVSATPALITQKARWTDSDHHGRR